MKIRKYISKNWFIISILLLGSILMFSRLGDRTITGDTVFTGLLAKNILIYGYPRCWDGEFQMSPFCTPKTYMYQENSWLSYYVAALPFFLFGINVLSGRIFFALFGLATIFLFYRFSIKLTNNLIISRIATLLLALSTHLYLYSRSIHYYSLILFFGTAVLYSYLKFLHRERFSIFYLSASSVLLFHSHLQLSVAFLLTICIHYSIFYFNKKDLKRIFCVITGFLLFTVPWILIINPLQRIVSGSSYYSLSSPIYTSGIFALFFQVSLSFYYYFLYLFPLIFLVFIPAIVFRRCQKKRTVNRDYFLLILIPLVVIPVLIFVSDNPAPGVRRLILATLPAFCLLNAIVLHKIMSKSKALAALFIIVIVFTNILNLFPLYFLKFMPVDKIGVNIYEEEDENSQTINKFVGNTLRIRYQLFDYLYEITHEYVSPQRDIINTILEHGSRDDIILSNENPRVYRFYGLNALMPQKPIKATPYSRINRSFMYNQTIDFIVIRENANKKRFLEFVNSTFDLSKYETIVINALDEEHIDTPDPHVHRFRTNRDGFIEIYHLKE